MCDYSLHVITSRPAKVGDKLIIYEIPPDLYARFCFGG